MMSQALPQRPQCSTSVLTSTLLASGSACSSTLLSQSSSPPCHCPMRSQPPSGRGGAPSNPPSSPAPLLPPVPESLSLPPTPVSRRGTVLPAEASISPIGSSLVGQSRQNGSTLQPVPRLLAPSAHSIVPSPK